MDRQNALLTTPKYGCAIHISSLITNMSLLTDIHINESKCGTCTNCAAACTASAIKGTIWNLALTRVLNAEKRQENYQMQNRS